MNQKIEGDGFCIELRIIDNDTEDKDMEFTIHDHKTDYHMAFVVPGQMNKNNSIFRILGDSLNKFNNILVDRAIRKRQNMDRTLDDLKRKGFLK